MFKRAFLDRFFEQRKFEKRIKFASFIVETCNIMLAKSIIYIYIYIKEKLLKIVVSMIFDDLINSSKEGSRKILDVWNITFMFSQ